MADTSLPGGPSDRAGNDAGIDTTPIAAQPPQHLIDAAERTIPDILANVAPDHGGAVTLVALDLVIRVQKQGAGHSLAAAQWAVHAAVRAGRLSPGRIAVELLSVGVLNPGRGGPAFQWYGGPRGTKAIPSGKPTPFDSFNVTATVALWEWWRLLPVAGPYSAATPAAADPLPAVHAPLPFAVRNWLTAHYLADPTPASLQFASDATPEPIVFVRYEEFATFLVGAGVELLSNLDDWKNAGWIEDVFVDLTPSDDPNDSPTYAIARLNLPVGRHRLVGIRRTVCNAPTKSARPNDLPRPTGVQSNGTQQGEGGKPPADSPPGWADLGEAKRTILTVLHRSTERLRGKA